MRLKNYLKRINNTTMVENHKWVKNTSLFVMMFTITTCVVAIEVNSIAIALKVAGVVAPIKAGAVILHGWIFSKFL